MEILRSKRHQANGLLTAPYLGREREKERERGRERADGWIIDLLKSKTRYNIVVNIDTDFLGL